MAESARAVPAPAAEPMEAALAHELARIDRLLSRARTERVNNIHDDLMLTMFEMFGVFRDESRMKEGLGILLHLKSRVENVGIGTRHSSYNQALVAVLDVNRNGVIDADEIANSVTRAGRPRIGLVLSGGGARGSSSASSGRRILGYGRCMHMSSIKLLMGGVTDEEHE
jgi:succinate dehydrogenase/fumarate reductase flavoprotein subunit